MPGDEIIIVDAEGTEHIFPAGFDPKRAGAIVQSQSVKTGPLVEQMGSRPTGGYAMSDSDSTDHPIMEALSSAAHPKTLGDFLGLLIPSELASLTGTRKVSGLNPARTTMRDVVVGGSKGLAEAIKEPTKSVAGTAIGGLIGGPVGAAVGAGASAAPKVVRGIKAETALRLPAPVAEAPAMAAGYERYMPNVSAPSRALSAPEGDLLQTLSKQPEVLPATKGKVTLSNLSEKELGLELGRLLQKLSTGKGGR